MLTPLSNAALANICGLNCKHQSEVGAVNDDVDSLLPHFKSMLSLQEVRQSIKWEVGPIKHVA